MESYTVALCDLLLSRCFSRFIRTACVRTSFLVTAHRTALLASAHGPLSRWLNKEDGAPFGNKDQELIVALSFLVVGLSSISLCFKMAVVVSCILFCGCSSLFLPCPLLMDISVFPSFHFFEHCFSGHSYGFIFEHLYGCLLWVNF